MTVFLKDVPQEVTQHVSAPFVIFGLLQHEHKQTVLNFTVQRNTEYDGSVRSKVGESVNTPRVLVIDGIFITRTL